MLYYSIFPGGDVFEKKRKKAQYVAHVPDRYEDYFSILNKGLEINRWDDSMELSCLQSGEMDTLLANDKGWLIPSSILIKKFKEVGIKGIQYLNITAIDKNGKKIIDYNTVANIISAYDCILKASSEVEYFGDEIPRLTGKIKKINKLILEQKKIGDADVFVLSDFFPRMIVSNKIYEIFKQNNFTGLSFELVGVV
ncbi:MAG TPA: DUF1629 domain-containing protein [Chitinispirillaceae bacterium]|nr:DUF1629 domain-containing protein [Chitinispirillaceae bacterium]